MFATPLPSLWPLAPLRALVAATLVATLIVAASMGLALRDPVLGAGLEPALQEEGLRVTAVAPGSPAARVLAVDDRLVVLHDRQGRLPLTAGILIEEPDQLGSWDDFNAFIQAQGRIAAALENPPVHLELADGSQVSIGTLERQWHDLPPAFWFQVAVGTIGFVLAAGVWAFRQQQRSALFFLLAGLGMLIFSNAAAVYSTRELAMDGTRFWALSMANHFGAQFFTASLLALLWNYPRRLGRLPLDWAAFAIAGVGWFADVFQLTPDVTFSYVVTLGLFVPSFALAGVQWIQTRERPVERAALKWFLLSIFLGTGLFAAIVLLPAALGVAPVASQGMMFFVFLIMFAGIALGITRYRLFNLDRWWFVAWSWFLGGLAVIAIDLTLVGLLDLGRTGALTLAIALIGWVYFPVRQWAWGRLYGGARTERDRLAERVEQLFTAATEEDLARSWREVLNELFAPLESASDEPLDVPVLESHGEAMRIPTLDARKAVRINYPDRGQRLFNRYDVTTVTFLWRAARRAQQALRAREAAVAEERSRIMRDLHDDLGAKLISLVHLAPGGETAPIARAALQDMREILSALEAQPCPLDEAAAVWRGEAETRAELAGMDLDWQGEDLPARILSARQRNNLGRIMREALTNAIRHADAHRLQIRLACRDDYLRVEVADDGAPDTDPSQWCAGLGTRVITTRAADLGGSASWQRSPAGGTALRVHLPLEPIAPPDTPASP